MSKRSDYAAGFKWGRREHNAELRTTKLLGAGLVVFVVYLFWFSNIWLGYLALLLFTLALIFRSVAAFAHKREKAKMDKLRFKRR